jgi:hypothetical protein
MFQFLWFGKKPVDGFLLVKWSCLAKPKEHGGRGIQNMVWFNKALETKILWRLIHNRMLWGRVLISKYLVGKSIEEWFRTSRK